MRKWYLPLLMTLVYLINISAVHAQDTKKISAKVMTSKGEPITGAIVIDTSAPDKAAITDINGTFTINSAPKSLLSISMLGYQTLDIIARDADGKTLTMLDDITALEETVVVGYGTKKKESLTGSISNITSDEILTTVHTSLSESLAGKISGFQVRQESGEPGAYNTSINIRGFGAPLYVIDGVPSDLGGAEFQRINPSDIESISVIKDASAAIFGLRAANGVVLVKTKRGEKGTAKVNYNFVIGVQSPTDMPEMCSRAQWAELRNEADINAGSAPYFTKDQLAAEQSGQSTDWCSEVLKKNSLQQQHSLSVNGGNEKINYYTSFGYVSDNGLLKTGDMDYDKFSFRANISAKLAKRLSFEGLVTGMYDEKVAPSNGYYNIYYAAVTCLPNSTPYINGNPDFPTWQTFLNPSVLASSERTGEVKTNNKQFGANMSLSYDFKYIKGLQAKIGASYQSYYTANKTVAKEYKLYTYNPDDDTYSETRKNSPSTINNNSTDINMLTLQAMLTYSQTFAQKHKVDATFAYEQHKYWNRFSTLTREYSFFTKDQVDMASLNNMKNGGMEEERASLSFIGRVNYEYASRYLIELAFREDGSYRYAPGHRWGFFPVVSAGWRISKEPWMSHIGWINELKLRASIGLVGEDAGDPFQYVSAYSLSGTGGYEFINKEWTTGASSPAITNELLTWYTSNTKNIGITTAFFSNRLTFEFDVYQRDREGLLATRLTTLPNTFGAELPQENLNSDRVRGFDTSLGWRSNAGAFNYGINFTLNYTRTMNKYVEEAKAANSYANWKTNTAYRYNDVVWGYNVIGQFQNQDEIDHAPIQGGANGNTKLLPGDYRYEDVNNDGVIDDKDMQPIFFNGTPKLYYGLTFNAEWKGIDASIVFQGAGLYTVRYSGVYAEVLASDLNTPAYFHDRWHQADPYNPSSEWIPGKWPATRLVAHAGSNYHESAIWRRDASYLRLKSLEIGYTLPKKITKNVVEARFYFSGHNLFTICDPFVKAFDPEKSEGANSMGFTYPVTKSFNFGVNLTF